MAKKSETPTPPTRTPTPASSLANEGEARWLVWYRRNQKILSYALLALAVIAVGAWLWRETGRRKSFAATVALQEAQAKMDMGDLAGAATDFQRIIRSYGGTDAAYLAQLGSNAIRIASGQGQIAVDELRRFVGSNPPAYYAAGAWAMLAAALENAKQYDEAATAYKRSSELAPEPYRKVDGLLGASRALQLAGKADESLKLLREILSEFSKETPGVAEATVRLAEATQGRM
jgi:tetratricopeptide (TPR) repeat protein